MARLMARQWRGTPGFRPGWAGKRRKKQMLPEYGEERAEMDPITLIVTALSAGAGSAMEAGTTTALKEAYATLRERTRVRLAGQRNAETVLDEHADDPDTWESPLVKALRAAGADRDANLIEAAQALLQLTDAGGSEQGKYVVQAWGNKGLQIGDGNVQHNSFELRSRDESR